MTDEEECGVLVYEASVTSGYDPFTPGHASITDSLLVFDDFQEYAEGTMTVQIEVK